MVRNQYLAIVESAEEKWGEAKERAVGCLRELAEFFSGEQVGGGVGVGWGLGVGWGGWGGWGWVGGRVGEMFGGGLWPGSLG